MRQTSRAALLLAMAASLASAQTPPRDAPVIHDHTVAERVKVYSAGPGVTTPQLRPATLPVATDASCKGKQQEVVDLSLIVDAQGQPRNVMFVHALGSELDELALRIVEADRFTPGAFDGSPVAVGQSVEVTMPLCTERSKDGHGKKVLVERLRALPAQRFGELSEPVTESIFARTEPNSSNLKAGDPQVTKVGGRVKAPFPLVHPNAEYTEEARRARINGACVLKMVVDANGMPRNIEVVSSADSRLDESALRSVRRYRFRPATRDGEPVPVAIDIEVNFRIY